MQEFTRYACFRSFLREGKPNSHAHLEEIVSREQKRVPSTTAKRKSRTQSSITITSPGSVLVADADPLAVLVRLAGRASSSSLDKSISTSPSTAALFRFAPAPALVRCAVRAPAPAPSSPSESIIVIGSAGTVGVAVREGCDAGAGMAGAARGRLGAGLGDATLFLPLSTGGGCLGRAYSSVHRLASRSCCTRFRTNSVAMEGTLGGKLAA